MSEAWIRKPRGDTTLVFVHGILSSGENCWKNANGAYWPELLKNEAGLEDIGIYVYSYQTNISSGSYSIGDSVDDLKEHLFVLDGVAKSQKIIFVCHSMGGIVVRKLIVERTDDFLNHQIDIGLFLVASPSLGSEYANWLLPIAQFAGHAQAKALRFSQDNLWLNDLDKTFINLKSSGRLSISGKEIIEDKFVTLPNLLRKQVVPPFSGAKYFGESYKLPGSDHFSIAKPENKDATQHRLLVEFIKKLSANNEQVIADKPKQQCFENAAFIDKLREKIKSILILPKIANTALRETLLKNQAAGISPEQILIPNAKSLSPDAAIREWRQTVKATLDSLGYSKDIEGCATEVMGWLILLNIKDQAEAIDLDKTNEIMVPVNTPAGIEVFVARLQERPAQFEIKGSDKVLGLRHVDPAELELGLKMPDRLREIEKLVYHKVYGNAPSTNEKWLERLKNRMEFQAEDDGKMYYLSLKGGLHATHLDTVGQLKTDLPHLKILITDTGDDGSSSIIFLDDSRLEELILHFLTTFADYKK